MTQDIDFNKNEDHNKLVLLELSKRLLVELTAA